MQTIFTAFYQTRIQGRVIWVRSGKSVDQGHIFPFSTKLPMHDRDKLVKSCTKLPFIVILKWRHVFSFKKLIGCYVTMSCLLWVLASWSWAWVSTHFTSKMYFFGCSAGGMHTDIWFQLRLAAEGTSMHDIDVMCTTILTKMMMRSLPNN